MSESYGKYFLDGIESTIIMEYDNFLASSIPYYVPKPPSEMIAWAVANPLVM